MAATLYFLLTGRAPFEGRDAAAALARIVSEPAAPMLRRRPDLPKSLDKVVMRGLERDKERRWKSFEDFRLALMRFVPGKLSIGAVGLRMAAFLVDMFILGMVGNLIALACGIPFQGNDTPDHLLAITHISSVVITILYIMILEGTWGFTIGKWLFRLRVCNVGNADPPGLFKGFLRTIVYWFIVNSISEMSSIAWLALGQDQQYAGLLGILSSVAFLGGVLVMASTMRARNGYRGVHELASGTRVVQLPRRFKTQPFHSRKHNRLVVDLIQSPDLPEKIGAFDVLGALHWSAETKTLVGIDRFLGRPVLLRACRTDNVHSRRYHINRPTRLRWIAHIADSAERWEVYAIPDGCLLSDLVEPGKGLAWREFRPLLVQLIDELRHGLEDGTLPRQLSIQQIWVQPNGQLQLLDFPLIDERKSGDSENAVTTESCWRFLQKVSMFSLEGDARSEDNGPNSVQAPLPGTAQKVLRRLFDADFAKTELKDIQELLSSFGDLPQELDRPTRAAHIAVNSFGLMIFVSIFILCVALTGINNRWFLLAMSLVFVLAHATWSAVTGGGLTFRLFGIKLARFDGRPPGFWRCLWRDLIFWIPLLVVLLLLVATRWLLSDATSLGVLEILLTPIILLAYIPMALWHPPRSLHDYFAGTFLVLR